MFILGHQEPPGAPLPVPGAPTATEQSPSLRTSVSELLQPLKEIIHSPINPFIYSLNRYLLGSFNHLELATKQGGSQPSRNCPGGETGRNMRRHIAPPLASQQGITTKPLGAGRPGSGKPSFHGKHKPDCTPA